MYYLLEVPPSSDPTKWIAILLGGFALIYLVVLRPMMRAKKGKDPLEQRPFSGMAQQRAMERDMQILLVEYEKMIRNMTAGVDTRAVKLELLIKEADDKIAELRALIASPGSGGSDGAALMKLSNPYSAAPPSNPPAPTPGPDPRHAEIYALVDQGLTPRDVARRLNRPNGEIELILALRAGSE
jgi:hypothetical protein